MKQETIDKLVFKHGADPNAVMWSAEFLKHHDVANQNDVSFCITTRVANGNNYVNETRRDKILQVGMEKSEKRKNPNRNRVYNPNGIAPTLGTMQGGGLQPCVLIKNGTKKGYLECEPGDGINTGFLESDTRRGRVQKQASPTLTCNDTAATLTTDIRIRKLTPLECWRLMGFSDEAFHKAEAVNSNTQLYKQAGNSIVVDVLEAIFANLFLKEPEYTQTNLF